MDYDKKLYIKKIEDLDNLLKSPNEPKVDNMVINCEFDDYFNSYPDFYQIEQLKNKDINILFAIRKNNKGPLSRETVNETTTKYNEFKNVSTYTKELIDHILDLEIKQILKKNNFKNIFDITSGNIPQYSSFNDGTDRLVSILVRSGNFGPNFLELGRYLTTHGKKEGAYRKYGENHAKLASLLDLVYLDNKSSPIRIYLTELGKQYNKLDNKKKKTLVSKLAFRIPIIKKILIEAIEKEIFIEEQLSETLSKSTAKRRAPNIAKLIDIIKENSSKELYYLFHNIKRGYRNEF